MTKPTPARVLSRATEYLERHGVESPEQTAEALMRSVLATDRSGIYLRREPLSPKEAKVFGRALCRRCAGEPTQLITGESGFRRLVIRTQPGVFVPRPETEVVAGLAIEGVGRCTSARPLVADLGTGTGAIALSIADECPSAVVFATDLSMRAVELARSNAVGLGLDDRVRISEGRWTESLPGEVIGKLDVIVSNPPYIEIAGRESLPTEVREHDPSLALYGDASTYAELAAEARAALCSAGELVVEIGDDMASDVAGVLRDTGFEDVRVHRDLTDRDRAVSGRKP